MSEEELSPSQEGENFNAFRSKIESDLERFDIHLNTDEKDQHLLTSEKAVQDLVGSAEITEKDTVLEIGPGPGQITELLAQRAGRVQAIEIDDRFNPLLTELQGRYPNVDVAYGDALTLDWPKGATKLVANPPFSILEPMLEKLADAKRIETIALVTGSKFYQRCFVSKDEFTRTSLVTRAFFDIRLVEELPREAFTPQSRENQVIMRLDRKDKKKVDPGLRLFVSRLIHTPNASAKSVLSDMLAESLDPRNILARGYRNIPTIKSLGVPEEVLRKRLTDLDNKEINYMTRALRSLRGRPRL